MAYPLTFGKYQLLKRSSVGGMAEVFLARSIGYQGFEKFVAVKRLLPNISEDEEFTEMFINEAKIISKLNHANICQILELGEIGQSYFIAMEYIHGRNLRKLHRALALKKEVMDSRMAAFVILEVATGLDYAHRKKDVDGQDLQLVHRDISPTNILVSFSGEVKIIDFGIAKARTSNIETLSDVIKGKCSYMSPEQIRRDVLDQRSDIFSLGAVLYEILTGNRLFHGETPLEVGDLILESEMVPPSRVNPAVPAELDAVVLRALERDLNRRYQWASEMAKDLRLFLKTSGELFDAKDLSRFMEQLFPEVVDETKEVETYLKHQEELLRCAEDTGEETTDVKGVRDATGVFPTEGMSSQELRERVRTGQFSPPSSSPSRKRSLAWTITIDVLISVAIVAVGILLYLYLWR